MVQKQRRKNGRKKKIESKVAELQSYGEGDKEKGGALGRFVGVLRVSGWPALSLVLLLLLCSHTDKRMTGGTYT